MQNTPFTGNWEHYVFTFLPNGGMVVYRNGVVQCSSSTSSQVVNRNRSLWIGGGVDINNIDFFYGGKIDDMKIYDRALTASEVSTLFTQQLDCIPTGFMEAHHTLPGVSFFVSGNVLRIFADDLDGESLLQLFNFSGQLIHQHAIMKREETIEILLDTPGMLLYRLQGVSHFVGGKIPAFF